jgi:hypothetical protein
VCWREPQRNRFAYDRELLHERPLTDSDGGDTLLSYYGHSDCQCRVLSSSCILALATTRTFGFGFGVLREVLL